MNRLDSVSISGQQGAMVSVAGQHDVNLCAKILSNALGSSLHGHRILLVLDDNTDMEIALREAGATVESLTRHVAGRTVRADAVVVASRLQERPEHRALLETIAPLRIPLLIRVGEQSSHWLDERLAPLGFRCECTNECDWCLATPLGQPSLGQPVIVHSHVPKTAGSALNEVLRVSFGNQFLELYSPDPFQTYLPHELAMELHRCNGVQAVASHSIAQHAPLIGNFVPLYVCYLRHPLARFASYFRFCRKVYADLSAEHLATLPVDLLTMDFAGFAAWQLRRNNELGVTGNLQVLQFAGAHHPAKAMKTLREFLLVGITEQFERGLRLLQLKLEPYGMKLGATRAGTQVNHTVDLYRDTDGQLQHPDVVAFARTLSRDVELYEWAKARFEDNARACDL